LGNKIDFKNIKMISCFGNAELKKFEMWIHFSKFLK
jgi:hypothetical protein